MNGAQPGAKRRVGKGAGTVRAPKRHDAPMADTMDKLALAIDQIQQHNASQLSFEEHYRYAYNLVLHKQGHLLYNKVAELVATHLEKEAHTRIIPAFPPSASTSTDASANVTAAAAGQHFLDRIREVWDDHYACMSKLRDVLKYMDKMYTTNNAHIPPVWELGLSLFFHHVILLSSTKPSSIPSSTAPSTSAPRAPIPAKKPSTTTTPTTRPTADPSTIAHHLVATLLNIIRVERSGEVVSRHSIHSLVTILSELTDQGAVPLPLAASVGTGSGSPVLYGGGSSSSSSGSSAALGGAAAAIARGKSVMGEGGSSANPLNPYKTSFEPAFLAQTQDFYARESAALLVQCDAPTFLKRVARRLEEEAVRAQAYLAPSTEPLLIKLLENVLITTHLHAVLDHPASGLPTLIADSRIEDLQRLYDLFSRVDDGPAALRTGISAWIVARGGQINEGLLTVKEDDDGPADDEGKGKGKAKEPVGTVGARTKAALSWVQLVLDLKAKFDTLLEKAFDGDKTVLKAIEDAFIVFVNQNTASPEYISLFIDENLKKGLKGKSEEEVDQVLDQAVSVFRFLEERDQFAKYYNIHLSKRLIGSRSLSDDAERNMLAKFKKDAGQAITIAAEGMLKDVKTSEEHQPKFKAWQSGRADKRLPFEMTAIIGAKNHWPFEHLGTECTLPDPLLQGIASYRAFYDSISTGRRLTFRPDYGTVEFKARFKARTHELTVSTYAFVVLMLFDRLESEESLSYTDISNATKIPTDVLRRTLQSLACAKIKVLTKTPKGRDVADGDVFHYNEALVSNLVKIKIQMVANKVETPEERKDTTEKLDKERESVCDACVVRVMKDRKQLGHSELIHEVVAQLSARFKAQPSMVKKAIERLIEKEYLERDVNDRKVLKYMA